MIGNNLPESVNDVKKYAAITLLAATLVGCDNNSAPLSFTPEMASFSNEFDFDPSLNSVWVKSLTGPRSGSKSNSFEKLAISGVNDSGAELLSHPTSVAASSVIAAYFFKRRVS